jgi:glycosyltransferase involved in cell wall biosynthesis
LAIVIPAFKPDYLAETLRSIAAQTDLRFHLYVGDDAGPEDVRRICDAHRASFGGFTYHRFDGNLGATSLASQWNRCVAMTTEPWVWLFSDDDLMLPDCVATLYRAFSRAEDVDVLRFDSEVVDATGRRIAGNPRHPAWESGADFVFDRLLGRRAGYAVDYVFRRSAFDAAGGFPEYPLAWGSDYAACFLFSRRGGIRTLEAGGVRYRESEHSISGSRGAGKREKFKATLRFLDFVEREVATADPRRRGRAAWGDATENWFLGQVHHLFPVAWDLWWSMLRGSRRWWRRDFVVRLLRLAGWNAQAWAQAAVRARSAPR